MEMRVLRRYYNLSLKRREREKQLNATWGNSGRGRRKGRWREKYSTQIIIREKKGRKKYTSISLRAGICQANAKQQRCGEERRKQ